MKEKKRDILAERPELKKVPYSLPEGYFQEFKANIDIYEKRKSRLNFIPYISVAASVVLLIAATFFLAQPTVPSDEFTQEDYLVFSSHMINSINSEYYSADIHQYADAEITNEDIIDYLIYSGLSAEEIEQYK